MYFLLTIFIPLILYNYVTAYIVTEGLNEVKNHTLAEPLDKDGFLLRAWRISASGGGAKRNVEPMGFFSYKDIAETHQGLQIYPMYIEEDSGKAKKFFIEYWETYSGQISISSKDTLRLAGWATDNSAYIFMTSKNYPVFHYYMPSFGKTEQLYIITGDETNDEKLGLIGEDVYVFDKGKYAFSVCDNYVPTIVKTFD